MSSELRRITLVRPSLVGRSRSFAKPQPSLVDRPDRGAQIEEPRSSKILLQVV